MDILNPSSILLRKIRNTCCYALGLSAVLFIGGCNSNSNDADNLSDFPAQARAKTIIASATPSSPQNPEGTERPVPNAIASGENQVPNLLQRVDESESSYTQDGYQPKSAATSSVLFTPYTGSKAKIYGSYNLGCIDGAVRLTDKDQPFQIQRWGKDRNYVHPIMADYIFDLVKRAESIGLPPLLLGDMSRPYGGPMGPGSSHASHETGLDLDIPFDFSLPRKSLYELQNPEDVYIVKGQKIQKHFTPAVVTLIKTAATDPRVDRIFVAPMIKKRMCLLFEGKGKKGDDAFLRKLRPWFGHQAHMHVRLKCPSDSPNCISQKPIPEGTGCGYEVDSWFMPPSTKPATTKAKVKKKKAKPELPKQCKILFEKHPYTK